MTDKISFSLLDDLKNYFYGDLCGNLIREKWVNDRLLDLDSKSARLGEFFEYHFTLLVLGKGTLPKNGKVPEREMYATGKQPLAHYARAEANAKHLRGYFEAMGLKIIKAGVRLTKGRFQGSIDLIVECQKDIRFDDGREWKAGDHLVFDMKYSGLIEDRWDKFGWAGLFREGPHIQKDYHLPQGFQYHHVSGLPFYFLVVSSTNEEDIKLIFVPVNEEVIENHIKEGNQLFEKFEFEAKIGFEARPSISKCNGCPLKGECKDKHIFPHPQTVIL